MKDSNAFAVIEARLKYDWIVLFYGFLCVLIQLMHQGDLGYFFILIGVFVFVEGFSVAAYRKLQAGGESYHVQSRQTLDQSTGVGLILFCMVFDFAILIATSVIFLVNVFRTV